MFSYLNKQICIVSYPIWAFHKQTAEEKYLSKSSKKQNSNFLYSGNYLHTIYIVLVVVSNLEMS